MNKKREQLCPLWLPSLIGLGVVVALAAAYPRENMQARSLSSQPPSELSIAYLEAWLRVKPDSPEYLESLATQYLKLGRWAPAIKMAQKLEGLGEDGPTHQRALLLEVTALERLAYEFPFGGSSRVAAIASFREALARTVRYQWDAPQMQAFVEKAREAGDYVLMVDYYKKLAVSDSDHASIWQAKLAEAALAERNYDVAVTAYFSAYDQATGLDAKRHYFLSALKVLAADNRVDLACDEADRRLGGLSRDPETLRYLLDLARQVNRTDLVTRYARALVDGSPVGWEGGSVLDLRGQPTQYGSIRVMPIPLYGRGAGAAYPAYQSADAPVHFISVDSMKSADIGVSKADQQYELVFKAFVESGQLADAEKTAQKALDSGLDRIIWAHRLAQIAEWNNHPKKALKNWLLIAQTSDDLLAWKNVLRLAPQFDDSDAYLKAWGKADPGQAGTDQDFEKSRNALFDEYMKIGHWDAALRVTDQLEQASDPAVRQRALLLRVRASEQRAYQFPPEDPRRVEGIARFVAALNGVSGHEWDVSTMTWLGQKAREVGDYAVMTHFYRELAVADPGRTSQWRAMLGDAALERQSYDDAMQAYFAAQDTAPTFDEKRRYFLAGLKALVAADQVGTACIEGERRAGELAQDPETLRYLLNLARQANRTDLMTRYARALVKYSIQGQHSGYYAGFGRSGASRQGYLPAKPVYLDGLAGARTLQRMGGVRLQRVAAQAGDPVPGQTPQTSGDYDLAFNAFVASKQLNEAEALAEKALEQHLDPQIWTPRLAQVAQWNNHPQKALKYWLKFAQISGDEAAWSNVLRIAPQLDDRLAYLLAIRHQADRAPSNLQIQDQLIKAYEDVGRPEAAMAYLKGRAHGSLRQPMLERYAAVAERSGNDAAALDAYKTLQTTYPANSLYAMHIASLDYAQGNLADALTALRQVSGKATDAPETAPYWRLYGELAKLTNNDQEAGVAYKHLLATGQADAPDLNAMAYFYQGYPIDAGRIAEMAYRKDGSEEALETALLSYTQAGAWPRIETLLADLTQEQSAALVQSSRLLEARAGYYLKVGRSEAALADLKRAVALPGANDDTRIAYLWALVGFGTDDALRVATHEWRPLAQDNSNYWGAFAEAEMRLNNPARAVQYLRQQQAQSSNDPLWLMALADAEEAAGHGEVAWSLRRNALGILQEKAAAGQLGTPKSDLKTPADRRQRLSGTSDQLDLRIAQISLSQIFLNGDVSRDLLIRLLKQEGQSPENSALADSILANTAGLPPLGDAAGGQGTHRSAAGSAPGGVDGGQRVVDEAAKSVVLAWAVSGEHNDLARAWLAREYANHMLRPADAMATLALAADDRTAMSRLLQDRQGAGIPVESRVEMLTRTGQTDEAQTLAFHAAEGAPDNDDRYETMVQTLLRDRPAVGADVMWSDSKPLQYIQSTVVGGVKLTERLGLNFEAIQRNQRSTDKSDLPRVPSTDREFNLTLRDTTIDHDLALTVGYRDALKSFLPLRLSGEFNRQGPLGASFIVGVNQFTDLSPQLQVGAVKDMAQLGMQWEPESHWFAHGAVEGDRFYSQSSTYGDRTYIGRGLNLSADLGYRIRMTYPDWNVRLTAERGIYSQSDNLISTMGVLLPDGTTPLASEFIPQNFTQYGVMVGLGTDNKLGYTRSWRPFLDAGMVHDSNEGWGPRAQLGVGGSLIGRDRLQLFVSYEAAAPGTGQHTTQIGLSYRLLF